MFMQCGNYVLKKSDAEEDVALAWYNTTYSRSSVLA